jgi:hypothetical protein
MATLSHQQIGHAGTAITYSAAAGGGDNAFPDERSFLHVKNGGGGSINVTVTVPGTSFLQLNGDIVVAVPNGSERLIGPLVPELAAAETFGVVLFAYSGVTSVTVAVVRVGDPPASLP